METVTALSASQKIVSNLVSSSEGMGDDSGKKKKKKNFLHKLCCFPQEDKEKESENCEEHINDRTIRVNLACCSKTYSTSSRSLHYKIDKKWHCK